MLLRISKTCYEAIFSYKSSNETIIEVRKPHSDKNNTSNFIFLNFVQKQLRCNVLKHSIIIKCTFNKMYQYISTFIVFLIKNGEKRPSVDLNSPFERQSWSFTHKLARTFDGLLINRFVSLMKATYVLLTYITSALINFGFPRFHPISVSN